MNPCINKELEMKIYHFTELQTAIEFILPQKQLRTNSLNKMNDPRESQLWSFGSTNLEYEKIYSEIENQIERQFKLGADVKRSVQVACFVKDSPAGYLNEMMWSHYGENNKGVCLEIDFEVFLEENAELLKDEYKFEDISYDGCKKPWLNCNRGWTKSEVIDHIRRRYYRELFFSKSHFWQKENEKRLIIFDSNEQHLSIKKSLCNIYLGLNMPAQYIIAIHSILKEYNSNIYNLYYENNTLKKIKIDNDFRPLIFEKYRHL
jgi:hypothetical protein